MLFSPFLATRYLKPKRTFVSLITVISILGVTLGVWAMIVVIAVFTGYGERIKDSILGFEPHLVVESGGIIKDWPALVDQLSTVEGITTITPTVVGQVIMDFDGRRSAPMVRGILPPEGAELERMRSKLAKTPNPDFPNDPKKALSRGDFLINDPYSAVIGDGMAEGLGIEVGDKLLLYSPRDMESAMKSLDEVEKTEDSGERKKKAEAFREITAPQEVTVTGIFNSGHYDFDNSILFVNLETAQILYNFDLDECHKIALRIEDGFKANQYQDKFHAILPQQYRALTWAQMYQGIFDAIAAERQAMYLIIFIIMIVGGFGIMNTMITVTYQKRSEIGLLKALGAFEGQIAWVFLFQGILVGILGIGIGLLFSEITLYFRNDISSWIGRCFGVDIFNAEIYKVDGGLPAQQTPRDLIIISISAFFACAVAALIPALIAAFQQPAKALRSE